MFRKRLPLRPFRKATDETLTGAKTVGIIYLMAIGA